MISSKDNKNIKEYLNLKNSKKARDKEILFVVEGVRLIFDAIKYGVNFKRIFLTENCIKKVKDSKYDITKFCEYHTITEKLSNIIKTTDTSQGAYGVAKKTRTFNIEEISAKDNCLALFKVRDPGNIGTLMRSAFCFGICKIILFDCCDIYNPKTIRSSMGAVFALSFCFSNNFKETINSLNKNSIRTFAAVAKKNSNLSYSLNSKKGVLILGGEANGIPKDIISKCSETITIKMSEKAESLNVATAGSILMYELARNNNI